MTTAILSLTSCAQTLDTIVPPHKKETYIENVIVDPIEAKKPFVFETKNTVKLSDRPQHISVGHKSKNMVFDKTFLYVFSSNGIERFSLKDKKWISPIEIKGDFKEPVLMNKKDNFMAIVGRDGRVVILDLQTEKIIFEKDLGMAISSKPLIEKNRIYIQTAGDMILCFDFKQNKELWTYKNRYASGYRIGSSPILYKEFFITGFTNGDFSLINKDTGLLHWNDSLYGQINLMGNNLLHVTSQPIVENDILYAVGTDNNLSAYKAYDGQVIWSKNISSNRDLLLNGDYIYILDKYGMLVSVNKKDGNIRMVTNLNPKLDTPINFTNMVCVNDRIFVSSLHKYSSKGAFIDPKTGAIERVVDFGEKVHDIGVAGEQLFALTKGNLYVL
ncbi:MAG: PQQ-like beta-propeller repeat protein [Alphaproteobacteria bacterium]|nr:MAG: PQQ-like beta-propeller repeat protein [Alphaproteobacteria bacterium]